MPKPGCPEQSGLCDDAVTFLLWKVARPQAEYPLKQNRGFAAAAASFFLSDQKETKESPGADSPCQGEMSRSDRGGRDRGFWERPAARALAFQAPFPPDPFFTGARKGHPGTCGRRGALMKGV